MAGTESHNYISLEIPPNLLTARRGKKTINEEQIGGRVDVESLSYKENDLVLTDRNNPLVVCNGKAFKAGDKPGLLGTVTDNHVRPREYESNNPQLFTCQIGGKFKTKNHFGFIPFGTYLRLSTYGEINEKTDYPDGRKVPFLIPFKISDCPKIMFTERVFNILKDEYQLINYFKNGRIDSDIAPLVNIEKFVLQNAALIISLLHRLGLITLNFTSVNLTTLLNDLNNRSAQNILTSNFGVVNNNGNLVPAAVGRGGANEEIQNIKNLNKLFGLDQNDGSKLLINLFANRMFGQFDKNTSADIFKNTNIGNIKTNQETQFTTLIDSVSGLVKCNQVAKSVNESMKDGTLSFIMYK